MAQKEAISWNYHISKSVGIEAIEDYPAWYIEYASIWISCAAMDREFKMSDPFYSIICWVIRLIPIGLMGSTSLLFHYRLPSFKHKVLIVLVVGYFSGVLSVWAYWEFAISFAPNDSLAAELLSRDGAPQLFAPFVMPLFVAFYFLLMLPITWLVTRIWKRTGSG